MTAQQETAPEQGRKRDAIGSEQGEKRSPHDQGRDRTDHPPHHREATGKRGGRLSRVMEQWGVAGVVLAGHQT